MKYAVQVRFGHEDDWLYVTRSTVDHDVEVVLYDSSEAAEEVAESWRLTGKEHYVKVVTFPM